MSSFSIFCFFALGFPPPLPQAAQGAGENVHHAKQPGIAICHPHKCCSCGADVDALGTHGLSCRYSSVRHCRHATVNDSVKRSLDSARIPSHLEPLGLYRSDGRRPDGNCENCFKALGSKPFSEGMKCPPSTRKITLIIHHKLHNLQLATHMCTYILYLCS